jgi:hypothetical protein
MKNPEHFREEFFRVAAGLLFYTRVFLGRGRDAV